MVSVRINGEESNIQSEGLSRITDVIEMVKANIDPDHMITAILLDGRDLEDADWTASTNQYETSIIEVETGTPEQFVSNRIKSASGIIAICKEEFEDARSSFQQGVMQEGNQKLGKAVNTLQAFFEWYGTLLELIPEEQKAKFDITEPVLEISEVCKEICQQQLYQSWWALSESIKNKLEPKLTSLESLCNGFGEQLTV